MATCPSCQKQYPEHATTCEADGEPLVPDTEIHAGDAYLREGEMVGEYRIEHKLGEGGFGSVYRAAHPLIGKLVAIKVLNRQYSSNPQMVSRFVAEARAVNQIRHRNIIDIFSFGALPDGRQYYVMELLEGVTFDRFIRDRGRLEPEVAIPILRAVARALDAAHAAGIAHRDLKPENIFLSFDEDGGVFPKLLDFGIAKLLVDTARSHKTRTGAPIGTPHYMSPEQCRGRNVDHRTDIYSFGVLTHVALTGRVLFDGEDMMDLLIHHTHSPPPPASSLCSDLSRELDPPILHMLEKDPDARPATIAEAIEALASAAQRAGYPVPSAPVRSTNRPADGGKLPERRSGSGTPGDMKRLAEAKSRSEPGGHGTLRGAEADVSPSPARRITLIAVAAGALVIGIGAALLLGQRASPPEADVAAQSAPSAVATIPQDPTPQQAATATPAPVQPMAETVNVLVEIDAGPKNAAVFLGAERLGDAPGPFRIQRGAQEIKLTVKADGYTPQEVPLTPDGDRTLRASLGKPAPVKAAGKKTPDQKDLENPF